MNQINNDTIQLLERLDKALERMRNDGAEQEQCKYYLRLQAKRNAIASGEQYQIKTFSPSHLIAYVGSHIPDINYNCKGELIKNKQDKKTKTVEALQSFVIHIDDEMISHFNEIDNIFSGIPEMIS